VLAGQEGAAEAITARIEIPAAVAHWKQDAGQRILASDLQTRNRIALQAAFANGLAVVDYERDAEGNGSFLLGPWTEHDSSASPERQEVAHD
jgi:predicted GNAT superfamily acetyltransferase